ncbi:MAG: exopolyphosphatase [Gammaproteobacteria bacterium]|jgi:exopolyphosphatase/guanosine-5'-triphosphate,3'-diphosphate pyrophosphatase|nr:exopolyphosphatase [Gammaproteobacteria bacterium]
MNRTLATIDLGSNSFHMLISSLDSKGKKRTLLRKKQQVKLRAGIDQEQHLNDAAKATALACLQDFSNSLKKYRVKHAKVIGTYTLRSIDDAEFLQQAESALGFPIMVITGEEEARLIYLGASSKRNISESHHTLVIDIGGGSTELILGKGKNILSLTSTPMGCVGFQQEYFADGLLTEAHFKQAISQAQDNLSPWQKRFCNLGWQQCLGSSGTIQTISAVLHQLGWKKGHIDKNGLELILKELIKMKTVEDIQFEGLREDRKAILPGGLAILLASFEVLQIKEMRLSPGGVREGILYRLIEETSGHLQEFPPVTA